MSYTATVETTISAPIEKVWEALTTPDIIKTWLFNTNVETDWQVGSPITYRGEWNGKPYEDKGIILKFVQNELLSVSYWSPFSGLPDSPENYQTVNYALESVDGQTTLTISQDNIPSEESREQTSKNWESVLASIKNFLEGTTA